MDEAGRSTGPTPSVERSESYARDGAGVLPPPARVAHATEHRNPGGAEGWLSCREASGALRHVTGVPPEVLARVVEGMDRPVLAPRPPSRLPGQRRDWLSAAHVGDVREATPGDLRRFAGSVDRVGDTVAVTPEGELLLVASCPVGELRGLLGLGG